MPEKTVHRDADTGREYWQVTSGPSAHQTLYFHNNGWLSDGRRFIFVSNRTGQWRLHIADALSGDMAPLDVQADVGSAIVGPDDGLYYRKLNEIRRHDLAGGRDTLICTEPQAHQLGNFSVSHDAQWIIFTGYDSRRRQEMDAMPWDEFFKRVFWGNDTDWDHHTTIYLVPSAGGVPERLLEEPRKVTHIQFSPASSRHICYCHELAQINGKQRLWLLDLDRGVPRCLFAQRPDQLVTHEWWSAEGRFVLGHLVDDYYADNAMQKDLTRRRHSIARVDVASGERELFAMEFGSQHYNSHPGGQYHLAEGDRGAHDFIYRVDLRQAKAVHTPLVRHGTRYTGQRSGGAETNLHVNPRGTLAYFNSDRGGCYNVYVLPL